MTTNTEFGGILVIYWISNSLKAISLYDWNERLQGKRFLTNGQLRKILLDSGANQSILDDMTPGESIKKIAVPWNPEVFSKHDIDKIAGPGEEQKAGQEWLLDWFYILRGHLDVITVGEPKWREGSDLVRLWFRTE